jgi:hypothetical protein
MVLYLVTGLEIESKSIGLDHQSDSDYGFALLFVPRNGWVTTT